MIRFSFGSSLAVFVALMSTSAMASPTYTASDFSKVRKFDAHVHANVADDTFLKSAKKNGFEILSINVDYPDFPVLKIQADIAHKMKRADPKRFHYVTTFSMKGFEEAGWTDAVTKHIDAERAKGAIGVKVWKNIGMVERDRNSQLIMLDDPRFNPVMQHIGKRNLILVAHQAEPKNCWLPLEEMTTENDRSYFKAHPEYHMFLHPEQPSYETLLAARDRFVENHPQLSVVGAHMGSLEWSVDELGKYLDRYPNATVDMAARMSQVQYQSNRDYEKVRAFFIKYQDRILYGSDLTQNPISDSDRAQNPPIDMGAFAAEAERFWRSDWAYLATGDSQFVAALNADAKGLALPKRVIDKIYYENARRVFFAKG